MSMKDLIHSLIRKFSQNIPSNYTDPNAVQQGQTVYDNTGESFIIIEDDPTTTHKVLMPSAEQESAIPQSVKSVEDYEFSTNYSVQNQDSSNPDPSVNASIAPEFIRNSTLGLNSNNKIKSTLNNNISQQNHKVSQDLNTSFDISTFDSRVDFPEFVENPKSGYSQIKHVVENMLKQGYSDTDILLTVNERFEKDIAERVLEDLRKKGIF